jgi:hypothetical protein
VVVHRPVGDHQLFGDLPVVSPCAMSIATSRSRRVRGSCAGTAAPDARPEEGVVSSVASARPMA